MKCILWKLLAVACLLVGHVHGEIIESRDIRDLVKYSDKETLVILDLNNVLMTTPQLLGSEQWATYEINRQMQEKKLSKDEVLNTFVPTWHKILMMSKAVPIEQTTVGVIRRLQKSGIPLMGLTRRDVEMAYPTHQHLRSIDIDLARKTVYHTDIALPGAHAKFIEGILFVGLRNEKGPLLLQFLDLIGYTPKKVVFIDDTLKNIESVEAALASRGIPFIGLRYGYLDDQVQQFDPAIANKQWQHFNQVLPDEEAIKLLICPNCCINKGEASCSAQ